MVVPPRAGERRVQHDPAVAAFVASLAQPQVRPRRKSTIGAAPAEALAVAKDSRYAANQDVGLRPSASVKSAARTAPLRCAPAGDGRSPGTKLR